MKPLFDKGSSDAHDLVKQVNQVYSKWKKYLGNSKEKTVTYTRPYFVGRGILTVNSGLVQIKDYATENKIAELLEPLAEMQRGLSSLKSTFHKMLTDKKLLNYFGQEKASV